MTIKCEQTSEKCENNVSTLLFSRLHSILMCAHVLRTVVTLHATLTCFTLSMHFFDYTSSLCSHFLRASFYLHTLFALCFVLSSYIFLSIQCVLTVCSLYSHFILTCFTLVSHSWPDHANLNYNLTLF